MTTSITLQLPCFSFALRTFAVYCLSKRQVHWTLEQHIFELHGSASIRAVFFNKQPSGSLGFPYTCRFNWLQVKSSIFNPWLRTHRCGGPTMPGSLPFYMRDSVSLGFGTQGGCGTPVDTEGWVSLSLGSPSYMWTFDWGSALLIPTLFKGQLYTIQYLTVVTLLTLGSLELTHNWKFIPFDHHLPFTPIPMSPWQPPFYSVSMS